MDRKSNEITAIPQLLKHLAVQDWVVTVDALNCQRKVAETVIAQGRDYAMEVKKNQEQLYRTLEQLFAPDERRWVDCDRYETLDRGHSRVERRTWWITNDQMIPSEGAGSLNATALGENRSHDTFMTPG